MRSDHRALLLRRHSFSPGLFSATFHAPRLARDIGAGQFVMLEVPGRVQPYLRRAYSVADADAERGEVEFLVKTVGHGTRALEELPEGSPVNLLGPLGNRFSVEDLTSRERVAVVAGGIGAAPFPLLYRGLARSAITADFFLGGKSAPDLAFRGRFAGIITGETCVATDDGSLGEKGFVTDAFARRARGGVTYDRLFACGPMPMFEALACLVAEMRVAAEFSTEAAMGCGFGACLGCVIAGTEKPFLVSCQEGPILAPERIAWGRV